MKKIKKSESVLLDAEEKEKFSARKSAAQSLRKDARINVRLTHHDLSCIKQIAAYEGLPYQTLIASILHKYAAGHLRY